MIPTFGMLGVLHTAKQYRGCYHEGSNKEHVRMYFKSMPLCIASEYRIHIFLVMLLTLKVIKFLKWELDQLRIL